MFQFVPNETVLPSHVTLINPLGPTLANKIIALGTGAFQVVFAEIGTTPCPSCLDLVQLKPVESHGTEIKVELCINTESEGMSVIEAETFGLPLALTINVLPLGIRANTLKVYF